MGKNKLNQNYWKSKFTEQQLNEFFIKLGEVDSNTSHASSKFLMSDNSDGNKNIPAGYTYLGQFLAHEMTFNTKTFSDIGSLMPVTNRTPWLDLDSVYGKGPLIEPLYYDQTQFNGRLYLLSFEKQSSFHNVFDFKRLVQQDSDIAIPIIPDNRNDENILVAHIHLSIIKFHNKKVDEIINYTAPELWDTFSPEIETNYTTVEKAFSGYLNPMHIGLESVQKELNLRSVLTAYSNNNREETTAHSRHHSSVSRISNTDHDSADFYSQIKALQEEAVEIINRLQKSNEQIEEESLNNPVISAFPAQTAVNTLLDKIFYLAKRETVFHFQWIILTDFLPKIVGMKTMNAIQKEFNKFTKHPNHPWKKVKYKYKKLHKKRLKKLPPIFTGAFFRFGHYMVLNKYQFSFVNGNKDETEDNIITIKKQFEPIKDNVKLSGFFFRGDENASDFNGMINSIMANIVSEEKENHNNNIIVRNLRQTAKMCLPSVQDFVKNEITSPKIPLLNTKNRKIIAALKDEYSTLNFIASGFPKNLTWQDDRPFNFKAFLDHTPPWFYMGIEAYLLANGKHLGPLAGRIVAEVIIKLLESSPNSILAKKNQSWRPLKVMQNKKYSTIDFLRFAETLHEN